MKSTQTLFLGVSPGLERLLLDEVRALGFANTPEAHAPRAMRGGVELTTDAEGLWRLAHGARLAESLRRRVGRFKARYFKQLRRGIEALAWGALARPGQAIEVQATSRASALYHRGAVAERAQQAIEAALTPRGPGGPSVPPDPASTSPLTVFVRVVRDWVQVSVDAVGDALLHRRGWRRAVGAAPLRETLAAACVAAAAPEPSQRVWDPFCGSGTIVIEAAARALSLPINQGRRFAFEAWPAHDARAYARFVAALPPPPAAPGQRSIGSDLDPEEVAAAQLNAQAAGLAEACAFFAGDFEAAAAQIPRGAAVVTNLPYGLRTSGGAPLLDDFGRLGETLKGRPDLGPVVVLNGHEGFAAATGLSWRTLRSFQNGGLDVALLQLERPDPPGR